jgi:16S rRNA (cytosine1402-N4)-methyltransferase
MHTSVMVNEVLEYLDPQPGGIFIDATINGGGHALAIAERIGKNGKLLGIDRDCGLITRLRSKPYTLNPIPLELVCGTFANIKDIAEANTFTNVNGILFDLGFSSFHIEKSGRGFSFLRNEPLDMRYNSEERNSARDVLRAISEQDLKEVLRNFGEERFAGRIARHIVEARDRTPIETTEQLVDIVRKAVPGFYRRGRIHFATRTFQALRMYVNDELKHVAKGVENSFSLLAAGGRVAVISFHSGEDRIIKELFRNGEKENGMRRVTKKPVRATREECLENNRARSAKLRVIEHGT